MKGRYETWKEGLSVGEWVCVCVWGTLKGKERRFEVNMHYTPPLFTLPYYAAVRH